MKTVRCLGVVLAWVFVAGLAPAAAQDFPSRPITLVFPGAAGGEPDRIARLVGEKLREKWGQPVVNENRPGAGGNIGAEFVAKAPADGHTLLFTGVGTLAISKAIYPKLGYDPDTLVPVSTVVATPLVIVAHNDVPARTLAELIAYANANPDKLNFGSAGNGTTTHLAGELFESMAKVKMVHVPYKGLAPALTDLVGKRLELLFMDIGSALPQIRAGKVRALAVTSAERSPLLPEVPAAAEAVPGYAASFAFTVVAPAGTPPAIVERLSSTIAEGMKQPAVAKSLLENGTVVVGSTPAQAAATLSQERERMGAIVRALGIKIE
ncbi:Bug family tripartite tricarboxylate transporter substrate binding protein [Hydrogenophaga sp. BPS33]|uniref:Bug family tripartite tricarboxylate transporter substrate binding protein n=1 Tax=Hydrogenophaga sp. BPS33 TaxID=2651974 RepID=UPI00131FAB0B|nr:tripartite tricarboxylate transporter substrate binding protein [Hydrogenophaga sp. BPS33]QHE83709.1 tripartite tricarboxylate transporter substrate binding protein [Hydrogenophaga sp. BPS33]